MRHRTADREQGGFGAGGGIRTHEPLRDRRLRPALPRPMDKGLFDLAWQLPQSTGPAANPARHKALIGFPPTITTKQDQTKENRKNV